MKLRLQVACAALASTLIGSTANAGLLDSPPPDLGSAGQAIIVYRMGPIHFEPGGWVDTTISCSNLAATPTRLAVEIFDDEDRRAGQVTNVDVAVGASVTFATSPDTQVPGALPIPQLPPIDHGKARVAASTKEIACTAINRMRANDGTMKEAALELIKKVAF